jgi:prefoldin beta subunit
MADNGKDSQESLQKLQALEQTLHAQMAQRSAYQSQLLEIENAAKELESAPESYRIIGNIMVKTDSAKLKSELDEKKAALASRIAGVERQEKRLREEMQKLQDSILKGA